MLETICQKILECAKLAGADEADVLGINGTSTSIEVRKQTLEQIERSESTEFGLRVFIGKRQAVVSGSDLSDPSIKFMAERAVDMAKAAPIDPYCGLADKSQLAICGNINKFELSDERDEPDPDELEDIAKETENFALQNTSLDQVEAASAGYSKTAIHLCASNGFNGGYSKTSFSNSCVAIARSQSGLERDYDADMRIFKSDLRSPQEIGVLAAERAVARLEARKPKTGVYPVLFDERISSSLIGHLLSATNGAAIARGSSWLLHSRGSMVLPENLSIIEDPHRQRVSGSRPFDVEGIETKIRKIVDNGILCDWTTDLSSSRKLNLQSTGNAARGTGGIPTPINWNISLTQGAQSKAELLKDMNCGVLVTSMIGSTINPNTGDYSRGASGFWVENGEVQYPISELTIAGNLNHMLTKMIPANDARQYVSRVVPSLLIDGMTIAGS